MYLTHTFTHGPYKITLQVATRSVEAHAQTDPETFQALVRALVSALEPVMRSVSDDVR